MLEITLRTLHGLPAIRAIAQQVPEVIIGAGTLTRPEEFALAQAAGAAFGVSPGLSAPLVEAARSAGLPWLPGVMTPSEAIAARAAGFYHLKFFPAVAAGGVAMLQALAGPLPDLLFCPTGGITLQNVSQFLACKNVVCVGGSWLTPTAVVQAQDWNAITTLAQQACALRTCLESPKKP